MTDKKIPYKDIVVYYNDILRAIYKEIQEDTPIEYGDGLCNAKYPDEYMNAYGWLQKADWRLGDVEEMENYYECEGFEHFGLENLHDVKTRIQHYLEDTEFQFTEKVTEYHKYDHIVDQRMQLINEPLHHDYWDYYKKLQYIESDKRSLNYTIKWLKDHANDLKEELTNLDHHITRGKYLKNQEELLNKTEEILKLINELKPSYKKIPPVKK